MIDIYKIIEKYSPIDSIFNEEEEKVTRLKDIVYNDLDEVDRRVILMYAELGSLRKLATELNVSATAIYKRIKEIRQKIYQFYDDTKPVDD